MNEKNLDLTNADLQHFHDTLNKIIDYYVEHDPEISVLDSAHHVLEEVPYDINDFVSE